MGIQNALKNAKGFIDDLRQYSVDSISENDALKLYATSHTIYTISNIRAENVASVPMMIVDDNDQPIENHPAAPIFKGNYSKVANWTEITMSLVGSNLIIPNPDALGQFASGADNLIWINPKEFSPEVDSYDRLVGYGIGSKAQKRFKLPSLIDPNDAIYLHSLDFNSPYEGTSPVEAAFYAAGTQVELFGTQYNYFLNRMIEAQLFQPASGSEKDGRKRDTATTLQSWVNRLGLGRSNAGRTSVLEHRWEVVTLSGNMSNLAARELSDTAKEAICEVFRFPSTLLTFKDANYAQAREAVRFWRESWLMPRCLWYADEYSQFLTKWYGKPVRVKPDFSKVLAAEDDARIERASKKKDNGFIDLHTAAIESGVESPDDKLKGMYKFGDLIVPIDQINLLWLVQLTRARDGFSTSAVPAPAPLIAAPIPAAQSLIESTAKDDDSYPSLFVAVSLRNNADLISMQSRLKAVCGDAPCEWIAPGDFHVTLLYGPSVNEELAAPFLEEVKKITVPDMALKVGSVHTFDNVDEHALHFQIRRNPALLEYQAQLYELATEYGIPLSSYSNAAIYKPHVTVGYLKQRIPAITFTGKIAVTPDSIYACRGIDNEVWRSSEALIAEMQETAYVPEEIFKEIEIAARKVAKGQAFVPRLLPDATVIHIQALTSNDVSHADILSAAKSHYLSITAAKSLNETRASFEDEILRQFKRAQAERTKKPAFIKNMTILLDRYTTKAFVDAFADSGIEDYSLDDEPEDKAWIRGYVDSQSGFIQGIADNLYADGVLTDDEISGKPPMWWNKSAYPAYVEGLSRAAANSLFQWALGSTEDHCRSCLALNGQKRTMKFWKSRIMPKSDNLACKGFRCDCDLKPATGKKNRGDLPAWKSLHEKHEVTQ